MKLRFLFTSIVGCAVLVTCNKSPNQPAGDYQMTVTWLARHDSLALFTQYAFSYQTGQDAFDKMYAYTNPAGFINTTASVAWNMSAKTGAVYFIKAGQCRLYLAGKVSDGRTFADSCLITVRNPYGITGDTTVSVNETAKLFLAPQPNAASMVSGIMAQWIVNAVHRFITITDTFTFSSSISGTYPVIASFVDTVHGDTAQLDTFSLKIEDSRLTVTWPARHDSLALFTHYAFSYQTGQDAFDSLYAYTSPAGFIDTAASVAFNLSAKTGTVYFIKAGQCRLYLAGKVSGGRIVTDSCLITVRNPYGITGDTVIGDRDTAKLFLAPQPNAASMVSGIMAQWIVNAVPRNIIGVTDTFEFSTTVSGTYPVIASFVDTVQGDTAQLDTFPLKIGDYRLTVTWPVHPDSLALFTQYAFSYQTGQDAFDSLYAYTGPAGFINTVASVAWNLSAKTGTVYFIKASQCRLFLAGKVSGGRIVTDSCLITVRNPYGIIGDTAVSVNDTAKLFLAPQPNAASMVSGIMAQWIVNDVSRNIIGVTDTFKFSTTVSGTYPVIASFVDTVHGDTAQLDTFPLKISDYRLTVTWPARHDSLALFTQYAFSYQTGQDAFDSLYAYTGPAGFIDTVASVAWNLSAKTGTVYFIKAGQCRLFLAGKVSDGRIVTDSCLITVRNPYSITGDTAVSVNDTAKLFLAPQPSSMAQGTMVEWKVNGTTNSIKNVTDTLKFSSSATGSYSIVASFFAIARGDTAQLDTLSLRVGYRIKTMWYGTGSGTISPVNPCLVPGSTQVFTITPAIGSVIAKLFKGAAQVPAATSYTWTTVSASDSLKVMFFAVPAQSKPIPAQGTFIMGTNNAALPSYFGPAHYVTLTYNFYMDSTEVTQADYYSLLSVSPSSFIGQTRPVENLTWFDAALYCNARSKRDKLDTVYSYTSITGTAGNGATLNGLAIDLTKIGYRLPLEAECEYACRAGDTNIFYWGRGYPIATHDDTLAADSNVVWGHNSGGTTQPVATKKANALGLYDLIGNVAEWCNDWYGTYTTTWLTDPTGPATGSARVERGGAWSQFVDAALASPGRGSYSPSSRGNTYGFRVVLPAAK
jgi:formylglycine-generating enzyme required for sulfatase activity